MCLKNSWLPKTPYKSPDQVLFWLFVCCVEFEHKPFHINVFIHHDSSDPRLVNKTCQGDFKDGINIQKLVDNIQNLWQCLIILLLIHNPWASNQLYFLILATTYLLVLLHSGPQGRTTEGGSVKWTFVNLGLLFLFTIIGVVLWLFQLKSWGKCSIRSSNWIVSWNLKLVV